MSANGKSRRRRAAGRNGANDAESDLVAIGRSRIDELKSLWTERLGSEPPRVRSAQLFRRLLAWRLQATAFGDLDVITTRKLRDIAKTLERDGDYEPQVRRDLSPGVVLTREWKGVVHKVTVVADGFQHLSQRYRSLSDIARTITGTRWSGPRFFGLEQKKSRKSKEAAS